MNKHLLLTALFVSANALAQGATSIGADLQNALKEKAKEQTIAQMKADETKMPAATAMPATNKSAQSAKPGDLNGVAPSVSQYGGQARLPGESSADCTKRLGGRKDKAVREQCGYVNFNTKY